MLQRPAECEKVNFYHIELPWPSRREFQGCTCGLFANAATNCQTSSSHFLWIPLNEGISSAAPTSVYSDLLFSLSIWLSLCHFLLRLPAPDPVGGAPADHRQVEIGWGGVKGANVISMADVCHETRGLSVSHFWFCICWSFINFWSMQILDGAFSMTVFKDKKRYYVLLLFYCKCEQMPRKAGLTFTTDQHLHNLSQWVKCLKSMLQPSHTVTVIVTDASRRPTGQ